MMKQLISLEMLIGLSRLVSEIEQTTIQVLIVRPIELAPYVDWWLNFPGWHRPEEKLPHLQNMEFDFLQA
jgi:hypothetical protein